MVTVKQEFFMIFANIATFAKFSCLQILILPTYSIISFSQKRHVTYRRKALDLSTLYSNAYVPVLQQ